MPWADKERCREAVRDWMRRNPDRVKAAKARFREKQKRLRAATRLVALEPPAPSWKTATKFQRARFRQLRRQGVPLEMARDEAYRGVWYSHAQLMLAANATPKPRRTRSLGAQT